MGREQTVRVYQSESKFASEFDTLDAQTNGTGTDRAKESYRQQIVFHKMAAIGHGKADIGAVDAIYVTWSNSPISVHNKIFVTNEVTDPQVLREGIKQALAYIESKSQPGNLSLCEDMILGHAKQLLPYIIDEEGLVLADTNIGMMCQELPKAKEPLNSKLRVEKVLTAEMFDDFWDVVMDAFEVPPEWMGELKSSKFYREQSSMYVGYVDDLPVSTANMVMVDGIPCLALVGTLTSEQRKGYATAIVVQSVEDHSRQHKLTRSTLAATPSGLSIYKRLGYQPTGTFFLYKRK